MGQDVSGCGGCLLQITSLGRSSGQLEEDSCLQALVLEPRWYLLERHHSRAQTRLVLECIDHNPLLTQVVEEPVERTLALPDP